MANEVKVVDPKNVVVMWGAILVEGFGPDTKITVTMDSDDTVDEVGVDGEVTIIKQHDRRATVGMVMAQTAAVNGDFSRIRNIGLASRNMAGGIHSLSIVDLNGGTIIEADNSWIKKGPDREWAKSTKPITWEFRCAHLNRDDGGVDEI